MTLNTVGQGYMCRCGQWVSSSTHYCQGISQDAYVTGGYVMYTEVIKEKIKALTTKVIDAEVAYRLAQKEFDDYLAGL